MRRFSSLEAQISPVKAGPDSVHANSTIGAWHDRPGLSLPQRTR